MDLNPESVDVNQHKVRLTFADADGDKVLVIYMNENQAWQLSKMIQGRLNMTVKRPIHEKEFDIHF